MTENHGHKFTKDTGSDGACLTINLNKKYQAEKLRITILDASRPAGFYHIIVAEAKKESKHLMSIQKTVKRMLKQ